MTIGIMSIHSGWQNVTIWNIYLPFLILGLFMRYRRFAEDKLRQWPKREYYSIKIVKLINTKEKLKISAKSTAKDYKV